MEGYSIVGFFQKGGLFMYPILLVFLAGLAITVERWVQLNRTRNVNRRMWNELHPVLAKGDFEKAKSMISRDDSTISQVLADRKPRPPGPARWTGRRISGWRRPRIRLQRSLEVASVPRRKPCSHWNPHCADPDCRNRQCGDCNEYPARWRGAPSQTRCLQNPRYCCFGTRWRRSQNRHAGIFLY